MDIVKQSKNHFFKLYRKCRNTRLRYIPGHLKQVEKWARKIFVKFQGVDQEVVLASVWLHDIGFLTNPSGEDHAIDSEIEVRNFLYSNDIDKKIVEKISHGVRSHRCKDVQPQSIEAKILAASDSASHFTDYVYVDMAMEGRKDEALEKLERDLRDVSLLPYLAKELEDLYFAWKKLLQVYPQ